MRDQTTTVRSSRLSGFYQKSVTERAALVAQWANLTSAENAALAESLALAQADKLIENVVGRYSLPLGIGVNFLINHQDYLIPMVTEESSVVAAVSFAARLARDGGGFFTGSTDPVMIAQIQLLDVPDPQQAEATILVHKAELLAQANTSPSIKERGGGPLDLEVRHLPVTPTVPMLIVHLLFDTRDAMGANAINTAAETLAPALEKLTGGRALLRILSNLTDRRRAWAEVTIPAESFSTADYPGATVIENIAHANAFAVADPYRAATHNKGIMNGIDAIALATGNDWRALEAGAHAYAARDGQYRALTDWRVVEDKETKGQGFDVSSAERDEERGHVDSQSKIQNRSTEAHERPKSKILSGRLELPLSVGIVGGATRTHPVAQVALKILGIQNARELSEVMVAVGLAQNLAALRALATEGIQRGHMALHARKEQTRR